MKYKVISNKFGNVNITKLNNGLSIMIDDEKYFFQCHGFHDIESHEFISEDEKQFLTDIFSGEIERFGLQYNPENRSLVSSRVTRDSNGNEYISHSHWKMGRKPLKFIMFLINKNMIKNHENTLKHHLYWCFKDEAIPDYGYSFIKDCEKYCSLSVDYGYNSYMSTH